MVQHSFIQSILTKWRRALEPSLIDERETLRAQNAVRVIKLNHIRSYEIAGYHLHLL